MYSEKTTLVGVKKNGNQLELTTPSNDLYVAAKSGEVLLQWQTHDEYDGVTTKYARLTEAFWDGNEGGNYSFKFDNGETYTDDGGVPAAYETDADEPATSEQTPPLKAKTETREFYSTTALYSEYFVEDTVLSAKVYKYKISIPLDYGDLPDGSVAIIDGEEYSVTQSGLFYVVTVGSKSPQTGESGYTSWEQLYGKTITIQYAVEVYPPNVINMYDPNDPNEDHSYYPAYASYDDDLGIYLLADAFDASPAYERLKRGQPVFVRMPPDGAPDNVNGNYVLVVSWRLSDDSTMLYFTDFYQDVFSTESFGGGDE